MSRSLFEQMISSRMLTQKDESGRMSKPIVRVAVVGIAVGIMVMILTLAVVQGFQDQIRKKVTGFGSHIQITPYDSNMSSFETDSMSSIQPSVDALKDFPGIRHIQTFAVKPGIVKNKEQLLGVVLKGVDRQFDWEFFRQNLVQGEVFSFPDTIGDRVLVSQYMADKLELETGKKIKMFFLSDGRSRARAFTISGIYNTGLTEGYDDKFVICDIRQVQKLNHWDSTTIAGYEILLDESLPVDDGERLGELTNRVNDEIDYELVAENIRELTPSIFSWLDVLDTNALIIIILMIFVGMINMISALLILIIDRTNMIGTLKALGASNWLVMKVFIRNGTRMILTGTIAGNILGIGLCYLQKYTGLIGLDEQSYYVKVVPVEIVWTDILLLNFCTILICSLALLLPVLLVTKITPVRALRFS
jgi:lipoprotein-releasing system permease protein